MSLKKQIISGSVWTVIGQVAYMSVALITNIILARILTPFEFGQVGILMFFITVASVIIEGGFGAALIRKTDVAKEDYSTVFVINFIVSLFCFLVLISCSGVIAGYYHDAGLKKPLIITGLILLINAFNINQNVRLIRNMQFKKKYIVLFIANVIAAVISIYAAYYGAGIWSLILFQLLTPLFNTIILFFADGYSFSVAFNKKVFKELYSFGVNTTLTSVISTGFDNIYQLILGKYFSISQAGLFYQAKKLQIVPYYISNSVAQSVFFSSLAKLQEEKLQFIAAYNKIMIFITVIMAAVTAAIFLYANSIILFLYGEKWIGTVFFLQWLSIASFFYYQELFNNIIFKVFNKTRTILLLEILKKVIQVITIVIGLVTMNIQVLLYGFAISAALSYALNFYFSRKLFDISAWYEISSVLKTILIAVLCVAVCEFVIVHFHLNYQTAVFILPLFLLLFICLSGLFKVVNFIKEFKTIKTILNK